MREGRKRLKIDMTKETAEQEAKEPKKVMNSAMEKG